MRKFLLSFLTVLTFTFMANSQEIWFTFETGNIPSSFTNDADYPWTIKMPGHASNFCIRSGNAEVASSTSAIEINLNYLEPGYIIFDAHCMGEGTSTFWDHCDFSIDGTVVYTHGADLGNVWESFYTAIETGNHTFRWSYTKDSSVNPTGDYFEVDNIIVGYGDPCIIPMEVTATDGLNSSVVTWSGYSSSFTLRYRLESATTWTEVTGITDNSYRITGLTAGFYVVQVQSDCDPGEWAEGTFNILTINSTANWYGYAVYCMGGESWQENYIAFSMQNDVITEANGFIPKTYAGTYVDGNLWYITKDGGDLCYAPVVDYNMLIGASVTAVPAFVGTDGGATEMSFDPISGYVYYVVVASGDSQLMRFNPTNPEAEFVGTLSEHMFAFAIDGHGNAYGITSSGMLNHVNLSNGSYTEIGSTGMTVSYVQSMAFDTETNELIWAYVYNENNIGLYLVNTTTGSVTFIKQIGSQGTEITGMFMVPDPEPTLPQSLFNFDEMTVNEGPQGWTNIDADGDGHCWEWLGEDANVSFNSAHSGNGWMASASYINSIGALYPDNYLVSPVKWQYSSIEFWAAAQDASYYQEHFGVAVSTAGNTDASDFTMVPGAEWTLPSGSYNHYEVDLSAYAGTELWVAIRHFGCTDMFRLNIDDVKLNDIFSAAEVDENTLSVYPNPAKDNIMVKNESPVSEYQIVDVTGAVVMSNKVNAESFDVNISRLATGVYVIRTYSDGAVNNIRFIKE